MTKKVNTLIITGFGLNCEKETTQALKCAEPKLTWYISTTCYREKLR